ncbi:MAG: hypothetical protein ACFBSC_09495 [Microcoleaceae cyanobacterium]
MRIFLDWSAKETEPEPAGQSDKFLQARSFFPAAQGLLVEFVLGSGTPFFIKKE